MSWDHTTNIEQWTLRLRLAGDTYEADVRAAEQAPLRRYINAPSGQACRAIDAEIDGWLSDKGLDALRWPVPFNGVHGRTIEEIYARNPDQVRAMFPGWEDRREAYPLKPWIFSSAGPAQYTHPE